MAATLRILDLTAETGVIPANCRYVKIIAVSGVVALEWDGGGPDRSLATADLSTLTELPVVGTDSYPEIQVDATAGAFKCLYTY